MGLHYQLENNELGLCLECGLVTEGGEAGCVAYMKAGLETLRARGLEQEMLDLFFLAYQLQHYTYFNMSEAEAVAILRTIRRYVCQEQDPSALKEPLAAAFGAIMLERALSPVFMMQVLAAATNKESTAFITQYVTDIWNAYAAYHAALSIDATE